MLFRSLKGHHLCSTSLSHLFFLPPLSSITTKKTMIPLKRKSGGRCSNSLSRIAASFDGSAPVLLRTPKTKPEHPACALPWLSLRLPFFRGGRLMGGQLLFELLQDRTFLLFLSGFSELSGEQVGQTGIDLIYHQIGTVAGNAAVLQIGRAHV